MNFIYNEFLQIGFSYTFLHITYKKVMYKLSMRNLSMT